MNGRDSLMGIRPDTGTDGLIPVSCGKCGKARRVNAGKWRAWLERGKLCITCARAKTTGGRA